MPRNTTFEPSQPKAGETAPAAALGQSSGWSLGSREGWFCGWSLDRLAVPILVLFSFALYVVTTRYALVGDDLILIGENPYLRSFHFLREIFTQNFWSFRGARGESVYYRPLIMFSFLLQARLFGLGPAPFHLFNVALNSAVVVMVYQMARRLWPEGRGAFWGALLFAALPVHTEDVATVSGISDLECALFFLAALLIYTKPGTGAAASDHHRHLGGPPSLTGGEVCFSRVRAWMSSLLFLLAALSKEVALAAPLLMVFYEHFLRGDKARWSERLSRYLPSFLLTAFYVVVHLAVIADFTAVASPRRMPAKDSLMFGFTQLGAYVGKLFWPQHLTYYWRFQPPSSLADPTLLLGVLFTLWSTGMVAAGWRRDRPVSFAIIWFFLTLAPVLSLAGMGVPAYGERYLYLPSVGLCWLVGAGLAALGCKGVRWRVASMGIALVLLMAATVRSVMRLPAWRSNFTLGLATVAEDPTAAMFHVYLGNEYREEGKRGPARIEYIAAIANDPLAGEAFVNLAGVLLDDGSVGAAEDTLRRGAQWNPTFSKPLFVLGKMAQRRGDMEGARDLFERALERDPNDAEALLALGLLSLQEDRLEEAEDLLRRAAVVEPSSALVHLNLGAAYARQKNFTSTEAEFRRAIELAPDNESPYLALAGAYEDEGKQAAALDLYRQIVRVAPHSVNGQFRLGVLALKMGRNEEALAALAQAAVDQPKSARVHAQLGLAYLASGEVGRARHEIETAQSLDPNEQTVKTALTKLKAVTKISPGSSFPRNRASAAQQDSAKATGGRP